ncbi:uncharacterized protein LOC127081210 [Lathyrus oleraceus]|uniref:uncharacterized protein LOC127081210 n=1 Tax=Pisum sativum TaxID=3888 RepID=UPI0021D397BE|nr:uncharacterized protein LOC127081210 [Pisum sativum]
MPTTCPTYGLPLGSMPLFEGFPGFMQSMLQAMPLPFSTEAHHVVNTIAPSIVHTHVQPHIEDQHQIYHASESSDEVDERHAYIKGTKENYPILENILRAMEGDKVFGANIREICLVFGLVIPAKSKTPDFNKYEGHSCLKIHLIMYYRCFQDLYFANIREICLVFGRCFQDLYDAFIKHYKYNMDMAPGRRQLLSMSQRDNESFKEYAQQWREEASQVELPLAEKELEDWFMDIMKPMFYEIMVSSVSSSFSDLVVVGIKVEVGLKNGKMIIAAKTSDNNARKFSGGF